VQKSTAAHWTNLSIAEEATQLNVVQVAAEESRIKIRLTVKSFSSPQAGEHQGTSTICGVTVFFLIALKEQF
jgi:hypothetical protein